MPVLRLLLALQGWTWSVTPVHPTVGDTVWLEAAVPLSPGWRLRPGKLEATDVVEPLADPAVYRSGNGNTWVVRYAVVAWAPGTHGVVLPPAWRLGPDGRADSVAGGTASFSVAAVIPDSVVRPQPRPALAPLRNAQGSLWPIAVALGSGALGLVALVSLRRRRPRHLQLPGEPKVKLEAAEGRWLTAGEPRAVAARASARLRKAIAEAVPEAHIGLSHQDCLKVVARLAPPPGWPIRELTVTLASLELVAFAGRSGGDVGALSRRAEALAQGILAGRGGA